MKQAGPSHKAEPKTQGLAMPVYLTDSHSCQADEKQPEQEDGDIQPLVLEWQGFGEGYVSCYQH